MFPWWVKKYTAEKKKKSILEYFPRLEGMEAHGLSSSTWSIYISMMLLNMWYVHAHEIYERHISLSPVFGRPRLTVPRRWFLTSAPFPCPAAMLCHLVMKCKANKSWEKEHNLPLTTLAPIIKPHLIQLVPPVAKPSSSNQLLLELSVKIISFQQEIWREYSNYSVALMVSTKYIHSITIQ